MILLNERTGGKQMLVQKGNVPCSILLSGCALKTKKQKKIRNQIVNVSRHSVSSFKSDP